VIPANDALIVDVPMSTAVVRPCVPESLDIVATDVFEEPQVTWLVRSTVESSEYIPMAMNDSVAPFDTVGLSGVTMIISRTAGVTVNTVDPATPLSVALIVDVPSDNPDANPVLVTVATAVLAEAQVTWPVRS